MAGGVASSCGEWGLPRKPAHLRDMDIFPRLLNGGAGNLAAYLAGHVLLCLLPVVSSGGIPSQAEIRQWLGA